MQIEITHWLEWSKSETLTPPTAEQGIEQQEFSFITGGNVKRYSHFGRRFSSFSQK